MVRYFYKEVTESFLYIALELCAATLAEVIEKPLEHGALVNLLKPKRALSQITQGLKHLHALSSEFTSGVWSGTDVDSSLLAVVHRDLKPQNILVTVTPNGRLKMLLSDFGLSKRLDGVAQMSFSQTVNNPGGTVGWRAPEILRGEVNLDPGLESLENSLERKPGDQMTEEKTRLTRAVDIFALGCIA